MSCKIPKNQRTATTLSLPKRKINAEEHFFATGVDDYWGYNFHMDRLEAFKSIARINLISGLLTFPLMVIGAWKWGVTGAVWGLIGSQLANCVMSFLAVRVEAARYQISHRYAGCFSDLGLFWRFSLPAVLTGVLNSVVSWGASALVVFSTPPICMSFLFNSTSMETFSIADNLIFEINYGIDNLLYELNYDIDNLY